MYNSALLPKRLASVFSVSLFIISSALAEEHANACQLIRVADLPMQPNNGGSIIIPVTFNEHPSNFILDTGAFWGTIREQAASGLSIKNTPISMIGAGGKSLNQYVTVPSYQLGELKIPKADFFVGPSLKGEEESNILGNIGIANLKHFDLEIDPGRGYVRLFLQNKCDAAPIYWPHTDVATIAFEFKHDQINIPVTLDGQPLRAFIDTGASSSTLDIQIAKANFGITPESEGVSISHGAATLDGDILEMHKHQFDTLDIGPIQFKKPWLTLAEDKAKQASGYAKEKNFPSLILGIHQLRHLHLYIDFKRKLIYTSSVEGDLTAENTNNNNETGRKNILESGMDYENAQSYTESAQKYFKLGQYHEALNNINDALHYLPNNENLLFIRGEIQFELKDYTSALSDFTKAVGINSKFTDARFYRARTNEKLSNDNEAVAETNEIIRENPTYEPAISLRCYLSSKQNNTEAAIADCSTALALNANDFYALYTRGFLYFNKREYRLAIKDLSETLRLNPSSADALYARGVARINIGDAKGAEDKLAATQMDPSITTRFENKKSTHQKTHLAHPNT